MNWEIYIVQVHTQTFEKGCDFKEFYKGGWNLKKILILRPKLWVYTQVSGEKLQDFKIICTATGVRLHHPHPSLRTDL